MRIFIARNRSFYSVISAFNRGHAVKLLAKTLEEKNIILDKNTIVEEILLDDKKGRVELIFNEAQC